MKKLKYGSKKNSTMKIYFSTSIGLFLLKFFIILNLNPKLALDIGGGRGVFLKGILNGSDGENYLNGLISLINEGIFSSAQILSYFPAGYPIVMYSFSKIQPNLTLLFLSTLQSAIFSYSVYILAKFLLRTKLQKYTLFIFLMIILNPTLSLSSLVIGYESFTASGVILVTALLIKYKLLLPENEYEKIRTLLSISLICGFVTFLQPRLILGLLLVVVIVILSQEQIKKSIFLILISTLVISLFPISLAYRNYQSTGLRYVSTNLGTTMNLGVGSKTTGSYWDVEKGIVCDGASDNQVSDSDLVKCVMKWYVDNPQKSAKLFLFKSMYFWSPWVGPLAEGTTGRNPWLRYGPYSLFSDNLIYKNFFVDNIELFISFLWFLSTLFFLVYGFLILIKMRSIERLIGITLIILILVNWGISLLTIGDHRFRIPILGASIFLQSIGIVSLINNLTRLNRARNL